MLLDKTTWSWAKAIKSFDDVPHAFKEYFQPYSDRKDNFPLSIFAPVKAYSSRRMAVTVIIVDEDLLRIIEKTKNGVITKEYDFKNIIYFEMVSLYLKSWMTVSGLSSRGIVETSIIEFNTVGDYMFINAINSIRSKINSCSNKADVNYGLERFRSLRYKDLKFYNLAASSILVGEKINSVILQPKVQVNKKRYLCSIFSKTLTEGHLGILMEKELILLKDYPGMKYGCITQYIFLSSIMRAAAECNEDEGTYTVNLELSEGNCISLKYAIDKKTEVNFFIEKMNEMLELNSGGFIRN